MFWWVKIKNSEGFPYVQGPFQTEAEAQIAADVCIESCPEDTIESIYEAGQDGWLNCPRPCANVSRPDGSIMEVWTDGSQRLLT